MADPKLDPQAKIDRANKHVQCLATLIDAFAHDAYSVDMQPEFWTVPGGSDDVIITAGATQEPPARLWGPVIGDVVHGFRSALDQLVWALNVNHQPGSPPSDPIPWGDPWRSIWFPIKTDPSAWNEAVRQQLWAIDQTLVAPLKNLQPFTTGQHAPDREPLAVLQELWNIDKHRHLHLVNATVELHDVLSEKQLPALPDVEFEVVSKRAPGPLIDRTEIGRARLVRSPSGPKLVNLPQVHMDPRLAIDVAFDQGPPAHVGRVLETLCKIGKATQAIVAAV